MVDIKSPNNSTIIGGTVCGSSTLPSLESITNNTYLEETFLTIAQENRKLEEIYSSNIWKEECEYEVMKLIKVIRKHIIKCARFVRG